MDIHLLIAITPYLILGITAIAVMLSIAVRRHYVSAFAIAAGGLVAALVALFATWTKVPVQVTPLLRIDAYTEFFMALLLSASLAVLPFCFDYFKQREGDNEELPLLLVTAVLGASVLVGSSHFAGLFLGLEILSIALFVLIGYPANQNWPLEAAIKYLILSGVSSAFLLMGMALVYAQSGTLSFEGLRHYSENQPAMNLMVLFGIILLMTGLGFKLSLVPFHLWTPDVYQGAPAPVSAFIATVSKGAVFALMLRYFIGSGSFLYLPAVTLFSILAGLSIIIGNLLALLQNNVKRVLAYSSIAHMGYLLVAFIAGSGAASGLTVEAVGFYLSAYALTTVGAFGVVSVLSTPQADAEEIAHYRGLFQRRPWLAMIFTLMLLSLAGIPLTAGFIGKFYVFTSAAGGELWFLLALVIIGSGLGLYYYLKIIVAMFVQDAQTTIAQPDQLNKLSLTTLFVLMLALVYLGVFPGGLIDTIQSVSHSMVF